MSGGPSEPIRVAIVDDQEVARAGFQTILDAQDDMVVIGEAATGRAAVALARELRPDVMLMDVRMPDMDGIAATRDITDLVGSRVAVLMLTTFDLDDHVYDALRAGASGFLLKDVTRHELVAGVRVVAAGEALLAPSITRTLIGEFARRPVPGRRQSARIDALTERELEVFGLVARGRSNAEIAGELFVGEATVKTHVAHVLTKLGVRDRIQIVILAYESGFISPGDLP